MFLADTIIQIYATSTGASPSPADGMGVRMGLGGYLLLHVFFSRFMAVEFASTSPGFLMLAPRTVQQTVTAPTLLVPPQAARRHYVPTCASLGTWLLSDWSQTLFLQQVFRLWSSKLLFATRNQSINFFLCGAKITARHVSHEPNEKRTPTDPSGASMKRWEVAGTDSQREGTLSRPRLLKVVIRLE